MVIISCWLFFKDTPYTSPYLFSSHKLAVSGSFRGITEEAVYKNEAGMKLAPL